MVTSGRCAAVVGCVQQRRMTCLLCLLAVGPWFAMVAGNPDVARVWPERAWWCSRRQCAATRAAAAEGVVVDEAVMLVTKR